MNIIRVIVTSTILYLGFCFIPTYVTYLLMQHSTASTVNNSRGKPRHRFLERLCSGSSYQNEAMISNPRFDVFLREDPRWIFGAAQTSNTYLLWCDKCNEVGQRKSLFIADYDANALGEGGVVELLRSSDHVVSFLAHNRVAEKRKEATKGGIGACSVKLL